MTIKKDYTTELTVDSVTIDRRDMAMLDAIDEYGSMHTAADELGRSYARLQNRIVELEDAVGPITERRRGGRGGGGTDLTETAHDLRRQFDRHEAALDGVARVTESVITGTVTDRTGELATVETPVGPVMALTPAGVTTVQISVRSDAVVLTDPEEVPRSDGTSLRNQFRGTVDSTEPGDAVVRVTVSLGENTTLQALITRSSMDRLGLADGHPVVASFKATAARATPIDAE